jgi:hypothetical protein
MQEAADWFRQHPSKEKGLPRYAHDSPETLIGRQNATGSSGDGGRASSTYLTLLGLARSRSYPTSPSMIAAVQCVHPIQGDERLCSRANVAGQ